MLTYFSNFNPSYNTEDVRRMKYIERKYLLAYNNESSIPSQSRLLLLSTNIPANPFVDEAQYEESLNVNYDTFSGDVNEFAVSHALPCVEAVTEYQLERKNRLYIPMVSSPGHANDYINMFLDETKQWILAKMISVGLGYEELCKRHDFYENLKNDRYIWCFPDEVKVNTNYNSTIREVIEIVYERVKDVKEAMFRKESNKSLSNELDKLTCLTKNSFEFGKKFLACLLMRSKRFTGNFDGNVRDTSYEAGKLHKLLDYVTNRSSYSNVIPSYTAEELTEKICWYISVDEVATSNPFYFEYPNYDVHVWSTDGSSFNIRKKFSDFQTIHDKLPIELKEALVLPSQEYSQRCGMHERLQNYLRNLCFISTKNQYPLIREFFNVDFIEVSSSAVPEGQKSNLFLSLKQEYSNYLVECLMHPSTTKENYEYNYVSKALIDFHNIWGKDFVLDVFSAYAILQRMDSVYQWIQEINSSLVSMIGGLIAFSEIPLRGILITQKVMLDSFADLCDKLYNMTVKRNEINKYAWHENLFNANELKKNFKTNQARSISIINFILEHHLGKNAMNLLNLATTAFRNLLTRVKTNLQQIRKELSLQTNDGDDYCEMDVDNDDEEMDMNGAELYAELDRCRSIHMPVRSEGSSRRRAIQHCSNRIPSFSNTRMNSSVVRLYRLQQSPTIRMMNNTTRTLRSKTTRNGLCVVSSSSSSTTGVKKRRDNKRNDVMGTSKKRKYTHTL